MSEQFVPLPGFSNLEIPKELMPLVLPASIIYQGLNMLSTLLAFNSQIDTVVKVTSAIPHLLPEPPKRLII